MRNEQSCHSPGGECAVLALHLEGGRVARYGVDDSEEEG